MESLFQAAVAAQTPSHNPGHESEISETIRSTNPTNQLSPQDFETSTVQPLFEEIERQIQSDQFAGILSPNKMNNSSVQDSVSHDVVMPASVNSNINGMQIDDHTDGNISNPFREPVSMETPIASGIAAQCQIPTPDSCAEESVVSPQIVCEFAVHYITVDSLTYAIEQFRASR